MAFNQSKLGKQRSLLHPSIMQFHWSDNAKTGLQFLPKWNFNHAIPVSEIKEAEHDLNVNFPSILRNFYLFWGNHDELTSTTHLILNPSKCYIKGSYLIIAIENQWVFFWGIHINDLYQDDPPVFFAYNEEEPFEWVLINKSVSQFLDYLLFGHAFSDKTDAFRKTFEYIDPLDKKVSLIKSNFKLVKLDSPPWGSRIESSERPWEIYYDEKTLVSFSPWVSIKSYDQKTIEELENIFTVN